MDAGQIGLNLHLNKDQFYKDVHKTTEETKKTFKKTGDEIEKSFGSSLKNSFKDFNKGFASGFSEGFSKEFKKVEKDGSKTASVLKSSFSKVGLVIAAAFSVKKIVEFGKESVQLASDLAEVQNVVQTAFPTMEKAVDEFASDSIQRIGMSEKTYKEYIGTMGLMAKSFGYTEEQALSMSKSLTDMVGDVSSIRNISFDESYNKMKAVFTGETEALKTLGVVMTQNALDQFALAKGMGKTTSEMTEQEKVALRYQFVMDKLNYAVGDFQKTSGGWANQTRMLTENFNQLKSVIGEGLIQALLPVIKTLNAIILKLTEAAKKFRDFMKAAFGKGEDEEESTNAISSIADVSQDAQDGIKGIGEQSKKTAKDIKKTVLGFDELNKLQAPDDGSDESGVGGLEEQIDLQNELKDKQDEAGKNGETWLDKLKNKLKELKDKFKDDFNLTFNKDEFENDLNAVKKNLRYIEEALKTIWEKAKPAFDNMVNDVANALGQIAGTVAQTSMAALNGITTGIAKFFKDNQKEIALGLTDTFNRIGKIAQSTAGLLQSVGEKLQEIFRSEQFAGFIESIMNRIYVEIQSKITMILAFIQGVITGLQQFIDERGQEFTDRIKNILTIETDINNSIARIKGIIGELWTFIFDNPHFANIVSSVAGICADIFTSIFELKEKLVRDVLDVIATTLTNNKENFKKEIDDVLAFLDTFIDGIETMTKTFFEQINGWYDQYMKPFFDDIQKGLDTILAAWHKTWEENIAPVLDRVGQKWKDFCENTFKPLAEDIKNALGGLTQSVQGLWNDVLVPLLSWLADKLGPIIGQIIERIVGFVQTAISTIIRLVDDVILVIQGIINAVKGLMEFLGNFLMFLKNVFTGNIGGAIENVKGMFQGLFDFVKGIIEGIVGLISGIADSIAGVVQGAKDLFVGKDGEKATDHTALNVEQNETRNLNKSIREGGISGLGSKIAEKASNFGKYITNKIPHLATGGYLDSPQIIMAGDGPKSSGGEIVSPVDKMAETFRGVMQEFMGQGQQIILNNYIDMDGRIIYQETKNMSYNEANRQGNRQYR